jgi:hypothetical protein
MTGSDHTGADQNLVPTGLASLDAHVEGGGLRPSSVLAVRTPARSVGRRFAFNLCTDRPVHYVALGHDPDRYAEHLRTVVDDAGITTASIPLADPATGLVDHLDSLDGLPDRATVLIDPLTPVVRAGASETASVLDSLRGVLDATGGLGVVLAVGDGNGGEDAPGRWAALSNADAVFSIVHETTQEGVSHHVAVDRLPMGQRVREDGGSRTFEVPPHLEMTLDTSKTLSP